MKQTQMKWIETQLSKKGKITRNECLRKYISRLGARISDLKARGYKFKTYYKSTKNGMDYVYELV